MFDRILGWVEGFAAALRLVPPPAQNGWTSPDVILAGASFIAAALSAVAALAASRAAMTSNKANAHQAMSTRRLEILRITSENISELLVARDRFVVEMRQLKSELQQRHPTAGLPLRMEIDRLIKESSEALNTMVSANEAVMQTVFGQKIGTADDWDDHIRSTLKKKQEINHTKSVMELKATEMTKRATDLHPF